MIKIPAIENKKFHVIGLGKTGIGAIKALHQSGAIVSAWDDSQASRDKVKETCSFLIFLDNHQVDSNIDCIFMSPGVPMLGEQAHPIVQRAKECGIKIISDFDLLYLSAPTAKYIGITGTNGKSTTTALIAHILQCNNKKFEMGGNIGRSVLDLSSMDSDGIYVLEASSYQLDLANEIKFTTAILLNISPDHLDRHLTMENYIEAKRKIFARQQANDCAIISSDYPALSYILNELPSAVTISTKNSSAKIYIKNKILWDKINHLQFNLQDMQYLPGEHNDENIAAAYAAALSVGCDPKNIIAAVKSFTGLEHRLQLIGNYNGMAFVNDSKGTNADSTEKALQSFDNIIWIAGGLAKVGGISTLRDLFSKVNEAFLIGEAMDDFANELESAGVAYVKSGTLEQALHDIKTRHNNGVVLLSPACASWDQFKSFEHRGEEFCRLVKEIFA